MGRLGQVAWLLVLTLGCSEKRPPHADTNMSVGGRPASATPPTPIEEEDPGPASDTVCDATFPNGFCYVGAKNELLSDGKSLSVTNDEATFTAFGAGVIFINVETPADRRWETVFAAASAQYFTPGTYYEAQRYPFNPFGSPGLDVSLNYTGCNELRGKFTVTEMETDPFGNFTRFAASFVQHCEYLPEPLAGVIHFNATGVPDAQPADPSACEAASPVGFCFSSQAGHREGYGRRVALDEATAHFNVKPGSRGRVTVSIEGNDSGNFVWQATLGGPEGAPLAPGHYDNSASGAKALFQNSACEALAGSFEVLAIEYEDPSLNGGGAGAGGADSWGTRGSAAAGEAGAAAATGDALRRFDVDFSYGCEQTKRELHGKLRYQRP